MGRIVEKDQGFVMSHSVCNYTPTNQRNSLFKIKTYLALTCTRASAASLAL